MRSLLLVGLLFVPTLCFTQLSSIELDARTIPEPTLHDSTVENWNRSQPGYERLPEPAKQLLYWTNYSRNYPIKFWDSIVTPILRLFAPLQVAEAEGLQKELYQIQPLPMLVLNQQLVVSAQNHSNDIAQMNATPSHTSTNGTNFSTRMKQAGIRYCATENIAVSSQSVLLSVILLYLDIGLPELGHRKALLNPDLREIGVGSALYNKDQVFLVQDFACAQ